MLNQEKMPGAGSVADTIEFMKQMWSGVGAPSMVMPSLSVEDINQKISDLKTVASWLELNLNMLKATIQTMEVQSATLSTLQAMSAILASRDPAQQQGEGDGEEAGKADAAPGFPFGFPMWPNMAAAQQSDAEPEDAAGSEPEPELEEEPEPESSLAPEGGPAASANETPAQLSPEVQSVIANPNAWWNLLQEQFSNAVGNALAAGAAAPEPQIKPAKRDSAPPRSENKTVQPKSKTKRIATRPVAKSAAKPPVKAAGQVKNAAKPAPKAAVAKPSAGKASGRAGNTSASARAAVVQSRQTKKPAPRKPSSP